MNPTLLPPVALLSCCALACAPAAEGDAGPVNDDAGVANPATDGGLQPGQIACVDTFAAGGTRKLFLNFEGATLSPPPNLPSSPDDAPNNTTSLVSATATIPAWRDGEAGRDDAIAAIRCAVRREFDAYDVDVTLTRPDLGPYQMMVLGGSIADVNDAADARVQRVLSCALSANAIALVGETGSDDERLNEVRTANLVLGALGISNGLKGTLAANNCTCGWSTECAISDDDVCTFSEVDAHPDGDACTTAETVDQTAVLTEGSCTHWKSEGDRQ